MIDVTKEPRLANNPFYDVPYEHEHFVGTNRSIRWQLNHVFGWYRPVSGKIVDRIMDEGRWVRDCLPLLPLRSFLGRTL